ncbi:hypothetical protein [Flagellimonas eckloniae]|uniref:hypothetical protein n=1 Tax=Flagellimonas eckloniae TaxID=346185 RepID=UPI0006DCF1B2|nr:hypothetical protein [Allomuricauda eckloniae]
MEVELKEIELWKRIRPNVKDNFNYDEEWEKAIQLFSQRYDRKFFNPIIEILKSQKSQGEGFAILTIQCALNESLASFRQGRIFNHRSNKNSPTYEYRNSSNLFIWFLLNESIFKNNFWKLEKGVKLVNSPFSAEDFYADVRCGLIHEARTKNDWHVNTTKNSVKTSKVFLDKRGNKISIYRTILHYRLKQLMQDYCNELRATDQNGAILRKNFGRKMDHLFYMPIDLNCQWWR